MNERTKEDLMTRHFSEAKMLAVRLAYRAGWLFFVRFDVLEEYARSAEQYLARKREKTPFERLMAVLTTPVDIGAIFNADPVLVPPGNLSQNSKQRAIDSR